MVGVASVLAPARARHAGAQVRRQDWHVPERLALAADMSA
jgi:hypothetical protein